MVLVLMLLVSPLWADSCSSIWSLDIRTILSTPELARFPEVKLDDIEITERIPRDRHYEGNRNKGLFKVTIDKKIFFMKVPNTGGSILDNTNDALREARHATVLDRLGVGPSFFGWVQLSHGEVGLIYEFIEGVHVTPSMNVWSTSVGVNERTICRVREFGHILENAGYKFLFDFQMKIRYDGEPFIVDSESFQYDLPSYATNTLNYSPIAQTELIAQAIDRSLQWQRRLYRFLLHDR